ncbi:MAG: YhdP family protein, partial [Burkholderiales bacterium]
EWSDEQRRAVPIRLEHVDFVLRNEGRHHRFAIRAAPPSELASAIDLRGDLVGRTLSELREWNGRLYAGFDYVDLAAWQTWVDYPFEVRGGRGALKLWLGFADQRLTELSADLALADVATRFAPELPLLELASVLGQFGAKKVTRFELIDLDGEPDVAYDAFARQLALVMQSGATFPPADFTARWEPARGRLPARGEIVAPRLELAPLALVGEYLPFPERARQALEAAAPEGRLSDVTFAWTGEVEQPATYVARGKFADVAMRPYQSAPGFSRLSGAFEASDRGGRVALAANDLTIDYPGIFSEPTFAFDAVGARVSWSFPQGDFQVRLEEVTLSSPDLAGSLSGTYRTGDKGVRGVDITGRLTRAVGRHVYRYIPALPPEVADWLREGIQSGEVGETRIRLRGDLDDFPFRDATKGEFRISGRVTGGTLEYADGWPKLTNVTADLVFDGPRLKISSPRANALGTQISDAVVTLPDLYGDRTD